MAAIVALLAEGVDRNYFCGFLTFGAVLSPSSRRAWIEISREEFLAIPSDRRPPRGGRG